MSPTRGTRPPMSPEPTGARWLSAFCLAVANNGPLNEPLAGMAAKGTAWPDGWRPGTFFVKT
jgi:hypothetical protein